MFISIILKVFFVLLSVKMSSTKTSSRDLEGYPVGLLSDCPGSSKEARISPDSLSQLKFVVVRDSNALTSFMNRTFYSYHQMGALAQHLDFTKKTVVFAGAYLDNTHLNPVSFAMGSVYKRQGYNVILLEYFAFTSMVYPRAARFLRPVGKRTAEMLSKLTKHGLDPKNLELVGLSHGGHAIGFIAKNYKQITGRNISRLTALDPAGPCFRNNGPEDRIDASDADFVEIIHTNIDGYGMAAPVGHIDFYVNGGEFQLAEFVSLPCTNLCSHTRAFTIWLSALLNPNSFVAIQCDSVQDARDRNCFDRKPFVTNVLGLNVDKSRQGIFYVMARNVFPYGMGAKGLKRENEVNKRVVGDFNEPDVLEV